MAHIIEDMRYNSQRDNRIDPFKTCFPTSVSMTIRTLEQRKEKPRTEWQSTTLDDEMSVDIKNNMTKFQQITTKLAGKWAAKYNPRYVFKFWDWYIEDKAGYETDFLWKPSIEKIKSYIDKDLPVIVSTKLGGLKGHIVVICGYDDSDNMICNDPFGDANTKYKEHHGIKRTYSDFNSWFKGAALVAKPD